MSIVNKHPDGVDPLAISLIADYSITASGVAHRVLRENGRNEILLKYIEDALQKHHISSDCIATAYRFDHVLKNQKSPAPPFPISYRI